MHHDSETLAKGRRFLETTLIPRYPGFRSSNPLKVGILDDIRQLHPKVPEKVATAALHIHCSAFKYLLGMKKATVRVNLAGETAGEVDPAHIKKALIKLRALDEQRRRGRVALTGVGKLPIADGNRVRSMPQENAPVLPSVPSPVTMQAPTPMATLGHLAVSDAVGPGGRPLIVVKKETDAAG